MKAITGILGAGLLILSMSALGGAEAADPAAAPRVKVGDRAPDFSLPSTMGTNVSLSDYRGQKLVLVYFYTQDFNPT